MIVRWLPPLAAVLCGLLTVEHAWSRDHTTSSPTAVLPLPGQCCGLVCLNSFGNRWRDALETVINSRKLTDAQANPSTQRKRYLSPIWQITLYFTDKEQLYALLKNKRKETYIKSNTPHK